MNPARLLLVPLILMSLLFTACVTTEYQAPSNMGLNVEQTTRIYDADIESVWRVIEALPSDTSFRLIKVDKTAGTVFAEFSDEPLQYVNGGFLIRAMSKKPQEYKEFLSESNLEVSGHIFLEVSESEGGKTLVTVDALYSVYLPGNTFENPFTGEFIKKPEMKWSFASKSFDTQTLPESSEGTTDLNRTFVSTGVLENTLLDKLEAYLNELKA